MDGDIFNQGEYLNPTGSGQWVYDGDFFIEPGLAQEPAEENNPSAVDYGGLAVLPTLSYPTVDVDYQLGAFGLVSWPTAPLQPHASNTWHLSPGEPGNSSTAMGANLIPYDQSQVWTANDLTGFALGRQYRPLPRGVVETSQTALTTASPHLPQVSSPASARLSASRTYGVQGAMVKARSLSYTTKLFEVKLDGQLSTANGSQGSFGALVGYHRGEGLYKVESTGRCAFRQLDGDSCSDRVFLAEKSGGKLIAAIASMCEHHFVTDQDCKLLRHCTNCAPKSRSSSDLPPRASSGRVRTEAATALCNDCYEMRSRRPNFRRAKAQGESLATSNGKSSAPGL